MFWITDYMDSTVGVVTGLYTGYPRNCSMLRKGKKFFFCLQNIQNGLWGHPCLTGTWGCFHRSTAVMALL